MSGGLASYRIRPNKVVDRVAFVELLQRLNELERCPIRGYKYVGLGGPSMEDFKLLHTALNLTRMVSLERTQEGHKRQIYNKPYACIECLHTTSADYLASFNRTGPTVFWLDYTSARDLPVQLDEFKGLLSKLEPFDIAKVTLNAHAANWARGSDLEAQELWDARLKELDAALLHRLPGDVEADAMTHKYFPGVLLKVVRYAAQSALNARPELVFQPLTAFSYADGQQMMTVTGILVPRDEVSTVANLRALKKWPLANLTWSPPRVINVPDLTLKEKQYIDAKLPNHSARKIHNWLGIMFAEQEPESQRLLETYTELYRYSPVFSEVTL